MKFCDRRPGTSTSFVDAVSKERILHVASDEDGRHLMAFHLYDSSGSFVAETDGLEHNPDGVTIRSSSGELLLAIPQDASDNIRYQLYNSNGDLLTRSDGARTMIYQLLRMEGVGGNWVTYRSSSPRV